jgi:hypothetical protein
MFFPPTLQSDSLSSYHSTRAPAPRGTFHFHRSVLMLVAPDPQLTVPVGAPALDITLGSDRARVMSPRGYGDGGEAYTRRGHGWDK